MSSKEEKKRISIREIDHLLENAPGIFKLADIAAKLGAPGDDELLKRLEQLIDGDANYFHTDDWECELKMHYFCRIPFAVTPEKWEIEEGLPPSSNCFMAFFIFSIPEMKDSSSSAEKSENMATSAEVKRLSV